MQLQKFLAFAVGGGLSVYLLLQLGAGIPSSVIPGQGSDRSQTGSSASCQYKVCAARFGIHTNIVVPVANSAYRWQEYLTLPLTDEQYLGFGWGERDWYLNPPPDHSLSYYLRGVRSLLLLNRAALRVQRHDQFPSQYEIRCAGVERSEYLALMDYIQRSFQRTAAGKPIQVREDLDAGTAFYQATGRYFFLHNSNHWTADGLSKAGIDMPLWAGFSEAVMRQIQPDC